jgi:CheY-like chemotaxis protein
MILKKKLNCILLVDDDEATNFLNSKLIKRCAIAEHVEATERADVLLDHLVHHKSVNGDNTFRVPDLMFLDINMPVMSGWEFLEEYNKLSPEQVQQIVVIMLTSSPNPDDELRSKKIGAVAGFLNKPLTAAVVDEVINRYFNDRLQ